MTRVDEIDAAITRLRREMQRQTDDLRAYRRHCEFYLIRAQGVIGAARMQLFIRATAPGGSNGPG